MSISRIFKNIYSIFKKSGQRGSKLNRPYQNIRSLDLHVFIGQSLEGVPSGKDNFSKKLKY